MCWTNICIESGLYTSAYHHNDCAYSITQIKTTTNERLTIKNLSSRIKFFHKINNLKTKANSPSLTQSVFSLIIKTAAIKRSLVENLKLASFSQWNNIFNMHNKTTSYSQPANLWRLWLTEIIEHGYSFNVNAWLPLYVTINESALWSWRTQKIADWLLREFIECDNF